MHVCVCAGVQNTAADALSPQGHPQYAYFHHPYHYYHYYHNTLPWGSATATNKQGRHSPHHLSLASPTNKVEQGPKVGGRQQDAGTRGRVDVPECGQRPGVQAAVVAIAR